MAATVRPTASPEPLRDEAPRTAMSRAGMPLDTFVDLAELYWMGLSTMVAALAASTTADDQGEGRDER